MTRGLFAEDERDRINAFDWNFVAQGPPSGPAALQTQGEFGPCAVSDDGRTGAPPQTRRARKAARLESEPCATVSIGQVMRSGGFDVVIGNPPYGVEHSPSEVNYLRGHYPEAEQFPDSYCLFMIKALQLIRTGGFVSLIVPNTFCDLENCQLFRKWLLGHNTLEHIWQTGWAFKAAVVDTLVFVATNHPSGANSGVSIVVGQRQYERRTKEFLANDLSKIDYRNTKAMAEFLQKVESGVIPLGEIAITNAGVKMYEKGKGNPPQTEKTMRDRPFSMAGACPKGWRPLYRGEDISRYHISAAGEFVNYGPWLAAPRKPELFESPKILMRRTDYRLMASLELDSAVCVNSCHVIKLKSNQDRGLSYGYILGLLNSRLLQKAFELKNPQMVGKVFAEIKVIYVERLPIRPINFSDPTDKARHDKMVELVDRMLELNKQKHSGKLAPSQMDRVDREIAATDAEIDNLVYELYGITNEERRIIEGT